MRDGDAPRPALPWLSQATLRAARAARRLPGAPPGPAEGDGHAVREVILAHHIAFPLPMITEAVTYVLTSD
jgi:hypothetical protein